MSSREEVRRFYKCDRCGTEQEGQPFKNNGRVTLRHDLHDFQGAAVAGYDRTLDLCDRCLDTIKAVFENAEANTKVGRP